MTRFRTMRGRDARWGGTASRVAVASLAAALLLAVLSPGAFAAAVWQVDSLANTTVAPSGVINYHVVVRNVGDVPAPATLGGDANNCVPGAPSPSDPSKCVTIRADFPSQLTPLVANTGVGGPACTVQGPSIVCPFSGSTPDTQFNSDAHTIVFSARVNPGVSGTVTSAFQVSGGGGANVGSTVDPTSVSATPPPFGIDGFDAQVTADVAGDPQTQAGAHPFEASTDIAFNTVNNPTPLGGDLWPVESPRDVVVDLPAGFVGDTTAADRCTADQLANSAVLRAIPLCPATSQVGTADVLLLGNSGVGTVFGPVPVFSVVPPAGAPARLGFQVAGTVVTLDATLRTGGDYGLRATVRGVSELRIQGTRLTLWGVPSDPVHNHERACPGQEAPYLSGVSCPSGAPRKAFLRNPTSCSTPGVGLLTTVSVDSWEHPGVFVNASTRSHLPPGFPYAPSDWGAQQGTQGCEKLPFDPALTGGPPADARAGGPAGFAFDLSLPQTSDPDTLATADLRKAVVRLPVGVRVSPSSADGLQGCSSAQIGLRSDAAPACPDGSKLGTVTVVTPLLAQPLTGSIYLAAPFDNPFNSLVAIYLVASGQGVTLKLAGDVQLDPVTGQITTTIDDNPQAPFTRVHLQFDGGPHAALSLPDACGTYTTHADLTSWASDTPVSVESSFSVGQDENGQACPAHFAPQLSVSTHSSTAGSSSPFLVRIVRGDLDQELSSLSVNAPTGLTGRIATVPLCPDAAAAAGSCPESSRIGDVTVGAGAGNDPFFITNGRAYLTGPYNGAPFGLSIVVPAVAGPFDLGNVVVRSAIAVDKHTAGLHIITDALPTILQGIPLDVRDIRVNVNRPGFFLNATSCAPKTISATFRSTGGMSATASNRYQASDCAALGFKPRMVLTIGARGHTAAGRTTPLTTTLTMPSRRQANLRYVRVTLPSTLNARLTVIQDACTRQQFETDIRQCAHAKAGTATAVTPLLRAPLRGGVYFVKNGHRGLPDLFVALRGQVAFDLIGRITIPGGRLLATTFATAPDVPVRSFTLRLFGDERNGSIGTLANLCSAKSRRAKAAIDYIAQNGRVLQVDQAPQVKGCPKPRSSRHKRRA